MYTVYFYFQNLWSAGWPKSKFANSNGYNCENMHFWPHVDKAKMCFGGLQLLLKILNKQLKNHNKWRLPKHILALPIEIQQEYKGKLRAIEIKIAHCYVLHSTRFFWIHNNSEIKCYWWDWMIWRLNWISYQGLSF